MNILAKYYLGTGKSWYGLHILDPTIAIGEVSFGEQNVRLYPGKA